MKRSQTILSPTWDEVVSRVVKIKVRIAGQRARTGFSSEQHVQENKEEVKSTNFLLPWRSSRESVQPPCPCHPLFICCFNRNGWKVPSQWNFPCFFPPQHNPDVLSLPGSLNTPLLDLSPHQHTTFLSPDVTPPLFSLKMLHLFPSLILSQACLWSMDSALLLLLLWALTGPLQSSGKTPPPHTAYMWGMTWSTHQRQQCDK